MILTNALYYVIGSVVSCPFIPLLSKPLELFVRAYKAVKMLLMLNMQLYMAFQLSKEDANYTCIYAGVFISFIGLH